MELWEKYLGQGYELVDVLKESQIGSVALVYDKVGRQVCVMKQMEPRAKEIYQSIREIGSPFVPSIYRLFEQGGRLLVIEEFIDGRTLADVLKYGENLDEGTAHRVLQGICRGLLPFHERNIIHRDIKPSNIMLTRGNEVRLIDFGIARTVKPEDDADTEFLGTKGYAPPEQYGFGQTDARSDIYSLGITMLRMLGEGYRGYLKNILKQCTALDPANRYPSVEALLEALEESQRRRTWKRVIAFSLVCLLLGGVGWEMLHTPDSMEEASMPQVEQQSSSPTETIIQGTNPEKHEEPREVQEPKEILPRELPNLAQESGGASAQKEASDPNGSDGRQPWRNRVFGTLYLNGALYAEEDAEIPVEEWTGWRQEGENTYFPAGWSMRLHLENEWERDFVNPVARISFNGEEQSIPIATIPSGETADVGIPLDGEHFSSARYFLTVFVETEGGMPENMPPLHWDIQFYLMDWNRHRMELSRMGTTIE